MDGENNGKPPIKVDDLGGDTTIFGDIHMIYYMSSSWKHSVYHFLCKQTLSTTTQWLIVP